MWELYLKQWVSTFLIYRKACSCGWGTFCIIRSKREEAHRFCTYLPYRFSLLLSFLTLVSHLRTPKISACGCHLIWKVNHVTPDFKLMNGIYGMPRPMMCLKSFNSAFVCTAQCLHSSGSGFMVKTSTLVLRMHWLVCMRGKWHVWGDIGLRGRRWRPFHLSWRK